MVQRYVPFGQVFALNAQAPRGVKVELLGAALVEVQRACLVVELHCRCVHGSVAAGVAQVRPGLVSTCLREGFFHGAGVAH